MMHVLIIITGLIVAAPFLYFLGTFLVSDAAMTMVTAGVAILIIWHMR